MTLAVSMICLRFESKFEEASEALTTKRILFPDRQCPEKREGSGHARYLE